jgi:restriction endonuclease S subunit
MEEALNDTDDEYDDKPSKRKRKRKIRSKKERIPNKRHKKDNSIIMRFKEKSIRYLVYNEQMLMGNLQRIPIVSEEGSIDIYKNITPITKVKTSDILESGTLPVVDQGQKYIAGYVNEGELNKVGKPVVIFGDHTREIKLVDFDFITGADGVKILEPILVDSNFFYILIDVFRPQSRGYGRHFKMLNDEIIPLPPLAEQIRIVQKNTQLLDLITKLEFHLEK